MASLNLEQMFDVMDSLDPIDTWPSKWGHWKRYHVVRDNIDYIVDVEVHVTEGVQDEEFELKRAKKTTKVVEHWEPAESSEALDYVP